MASISDLKSFHLTDDERYMLIRGLGDWGGPAHATDALARAMGFDGVPDLIESSGWIASAVEAGDPLSRRDWARALVATEFAYVSNVFGTGTEWVVINGSSDHFWIDVLRGLQEKVRTAHHRMNPPV